MRCACYVASLIERTPKRAWSLFIEYDGGFLALLVPRVMLLVPGWSKGRTVWPKRLSTVARFRRSWVDGS